MNITHESLYDLPLIFEFSKRLNIPSIIDSSFQTHGNRKGLSEGQIVIGWLSHILTQNNHCKSPVGEWVDNQKITLEALLGERISDTDFDDNRLGRVLKQFANDEYWHTIEKKLYQDSFSVLNLDTNAPESFKGTALIKHGIQKTIKIDATTSYGYHEVIEEGIMQRGRSKINRGDIPQLKIMASVEGNTGFQIASEVVAGNVNDDLLYIPVLERTRKILNTSNCLICGDCKMSSFSIRANIVKNNEYYLTPIQLNYAQKNLLIELVDSIVNGSQDANLIFDVNDKGKPKIIAAGYEIQRAQQYQESKENPSIEWNERLLVIKSFDHSKQEIDRFRKEVKKLAEKLSTTESKLHKLKEDAENELLETIKELSSDSLYDLFSFKTEVIIEEKELKRTEKRKGITRSGTYKVIKFRAKIIDVTEIQKDITAKEHKMGWRIYVTNAPKELLTYSSAYIFYRKTMYVIEIGFHYVKDYLNISPLYVREQDQILGMTRLLMLALKILTLMSAELRNNMKKENIVLKGLYAGQPVRMHSEPTSRSILEYFSRQNIAILGYNVEEVQHWQITKLPDTCKAILKLLGLPEDTYDGLPDKIMKMTAGLENEQKKCEN
jgi:transposase